MIALAFAATILIGTLILMLPISKEGPGGASAITALFTATSAVCVTGDIVVDTATFWTPFGKVVILLLIQIGGFGIMTFASVIGLTILRRLSLRSKLTTAAEAHSLALEDLNSSLTSILPPLRRFRRRRQRLSTLFQG